MEGITVTFRRLLVLALIAGLPGLAGAQFTTFIPPVNKTADSVKAAVAVAQQVQQDSVVTAQMTNMKTWVDSAAGMTPTPETPADSLAAGLPAPVPTSLDSAMFANGARAPATASSLPLLLLLGLGFVAAGVAIVCVDPPRERVRVRARDRGV
jgi:hypothetical protein